MFQALMILFDNIFRQGETTKINSSKVRERELSSFQFIDLSVVN